MKNILSFDGGALKILFAVRVLKLLKQDELLYKKFDTVCGTSSGSIVAAMFSQGYTFEYIEEVLVQFFQSFEYSMIKRGFKKSSSELLTARIRGLLDEKPITFEKEIIITLTSLYPIKAVVYNSMKVQWSAVDLINIVAASCAIPTHFLPKLIRGKKYLDGGMWSLSPLQAIAHKLTQNHNVLSFGTGILVINQKMLEENYINPLIGIELGMAQTRLITDRAMFELTLATNLLRINFSTDTNIGYNHKNDIPVVFKKADDYVRNDKKILLDWLNNP